MRVDVLREAVFTRCFWPGWFYALEYDLAFRYRIIACPMFQLFWLGFRWLGVAPVCACVRVLFVNRYAGLDTL
jgi:hypothetical protein